MRYRLRTLMIVVSAVCLFLGWNAYLRRMAAYHREKAMEEWIASVLVLSEPGPGSRDLTFEGPHSPHMQRSFEHSGRARDFDHALLRPWLAFVHREPGSTFGAPSAKPFP